MLFREQMFWINRIVIINILVMAFIAINNRQRLLNNRQRKINNNLLKRVETNKRINIKCQMDQFMQVK